MENNNNSKLDNIPNELQGLIIRYIDQPVQLEKLFRKNKNDFQKEFNAVYSTIKHLPAAEIWNERLNFKEEDIYWGAKNDFIFIFFTALITGLLAKIPEFTGVDPDQFYPRNLGLLALPMLMIFFSWKQEINYKKLILPVVLVVIAAIYINLLPNIDQSDSSLLACIHLPIFLWSILGYTFIGGDLSATPKKIEFLRYNGDFVVMTAIFMLSGGLFSAITINLFKIIDINIEDFYFQQIAIWGLASVPILSTYLVRNNPQLVGRVSPVIAKFFTPVVFFTLLVFLSVLIYTGKSLYTDRNFLLIFNALLIGVMAIILFSITEATKNTFGKWSQFFLVGLSFLTIVLNGIALSAILFRLFEYGITPNRIAVLGSNLLIFTNLIFVAYQLYFNLRKQTGLQKVENVIAIFIPIYGIWTAVVTFLLPFLFAFK